MLSSCLKRGYLQASPWVFGQSTIPKDFSQTTDDPLINLVIPKQKAGFIYAFNSILDAYCNHDLEILKQCMEKSLFEYVKQGLSDLAKENIRFKRLHENNPTVIPLDLTIISGLGIERSKNPSKGNVSLLNLGEASSSLFSMAQNILGSMIPKEMALAIKKSQIYYGPGVINSLITRADIAFKGENFLGLFRENEELTTKYNGNSYHVLRFESEIKKPDGMQQFKSSFDIANKLKELKDINYEHNWILVDIDNQLGGNPLLKD